MNYSVNDFGTTGCSLQKDMYCTLHQNKFLMNQNTLKIFDQKQNSRKHGRISEWGNLFLNTLKKLEVIKDQQIQTYKSNFHI